MVQCEEPCAAWEAACSAMAGPVCLVTRRALLCRERTLSPYSAPWNPFSQPCALAHTCSLPSSMRHTRMLLVACTTTRRPNFDCGQDMRREVATCKSACVRDSFLDFSFYFIYYYVIISIIFTRTAGELVQKFYKLQCSSTLPS